MKDTFLFFFFLKGTIPSWDMSWAQIDTAISHGASHSGLHKHRLQTLISSPPFPTLLCTTSDSEEQTGSPSASAGQLPAHRECKQQAASWCEGSPIAVISRLIICSFSTELLSSRLRRKSTNYRKKCCLLSPGTFFDKLRKTRLVPHEGKDSIYKGSSHTSCSNK